MPLNSKKITAKPTLNYVDPIERDSVLIDVLKQVTESGKLISLKEMTERDPQQQTCPDQFRQTT